MFHLRRTLAAAAAFSLGIVAITTLWADADAPFLVVDGDGWLTSNASYGPQGWVPLSVARPVFGLQLSERNDLPFDKGTAGATFWVRNANCGFHFAGFGQACGWQLGLAVTQFRSVVVGGDGIEIDGLDAGVPYGRVVNSSNRGSHLVGLLTNAFVDFSGVDQPAAASWFSGFDVGRDAFFIRRARAGGLGFVDAFEVDRDGNASIAGSVAAARTLQHAANQWATRAPLEHGRLTFRYASAFQTTPVCVATGEGPAHLRVAPTPSECTVSSDDANDSSMVDVIVVGNPQ